MSNLVRIRGESQVRLASVLGAVENYVDATPGDELSHRDASRLIAVGQAIQMKIRSGLEQSTETMSPSGQDRSVENVRVNDPPLVISTGPATSPLVTITNGWASMLERRSLLIYRNDIVGLTAEESIELGEIDRIIKVTIDVMFPSIQWRWCDRGRQ